MATRRSKRKVKEEDKEADEDKTDAPTTLGPVTRSSASVRPAVLQHDAILPRPGRATPARTAKLYASAPRKQQEPDRMADAPAALKVKPRPARKVRLPATAARLCLLVNYRSPCCSK